MKQFFDGLERRAERGVGGQGSFELPQREGVRCPDCLEPSLSLSEAELLLDDSGAVGMSYAAECASCGFTVCRDYSYRVPLMAVLDAVVMLDLKLAT